jgi:phosphoglycolate phosphatase-like HAD superfamily hydrolase
MLKKSVKSVVFDLDGVLIDSRGSMKDSWERVRNKYSLSCTFDDYFKNIGVPFVEIMRKVGVTENVSELKKDYFAYTKESISLVKPYDGAKEIFYFLRDKGISSGIITSKERENTLLICEEFDLTPDEIITPCDVKFGKPDRSSGDEYIARTGFKKENIIYIGDMESDYIFAKNIGFKFIFADYGYGFIEDNNCDRVNKISSISNFLY